MLPATEAPLDVLTETIACARSPGYFLDTWSRIYSATDTTWIPFHLWPAQVGALALVQRARWTCILKARQLGESWLVLGYALWLLLFRPAATVLIFSKREEEARYLLGPERLQGMYARLPAWLQRARPLPGGGTRWALGNGSVAQAFPCNGGDGRTATLAFVDEFDLLDASEQATLMTAVKPTIDAGAQMIVISKAHKATPQSAFKRLYLGAPANGWARLFLPWTARPDRDAAWYATQRIEILARTGATDELYENYPATAAEALAPAALEKRIPPDWLLPCYVPAPPLADLPDGAPALPGLEVWQPPLPGRTYVIGADPAEGNPTSDASAAQVLNAATGEQVARLSGRIEPATFAAALAALAGWYTRAGILPERNNHGHAVLAALRAHPTQPRVLTGLDGRPGWLDSRPGKVALYDAVADAIRLGDATIHSETTYLQLAGIVGNTLLAPPGEADDDADAYALAQVARLTGRAGAGAAPDVHVTLEAW